MQEFRISIYADWVPLLDSLDTCGHPFTYQVAPDQEAAARGPLDKVQVIIRTENPEALFWIGFFLERRYAERTREHYEMGDHLQLEVVVPGSFLLVCTRFGLQPLQVLTFFAGDLSQHPFTTNGSDERWMARDYFLRAYGSALEPDACMELFDELTELRSAWHQYGNPRMDEYKQYYRGQLALLHANQKEVGQ